MEKNDLSFFAECDYKLCDCALFLFLVILVTIIYYFTLLYTISFYFILLTLFVYML